MIDRYYSERSILYNIEPIGIGTPYVESLTSYISRLSNSHGLPFGIFLSKLLAPKLRKQYIILIGQRGGNGFYDCSSGVNSTGVLATDFIKVIQELNHRTDLDKLTLSFWTDILPTRHLIRKKKHGVVHVITNL